MQEKDARAPHSIWLYSL